MGTGHNEMHTHWTPAAKKALVRPTTPSEVTLQLDSGYNLRPPKRHTSVGWSQTRSNLLNLWFYLRTTSLTAKHRSSMSAAVRRKSLSGGLSHKLSASHTLSLSSSAPRSLSGLLWLLNELSPSWPAVSPGADAPHGDFSLGLPPALSLPLCSWPGARIRAASFHEIWVAKWTHSAWLRAARTRSFVALAPVRGWHPSCSPSQRASSWAEGKGPHNQRPITEGGRRGAPTTAATEPPSEQNNGPPRRGWGCGPNTEALIDYLLVIIISVFHYSNIIKRKHITKERW